MGLATRIMMLLTAPFFLVLAFKMVFASDTARSRGGGVDDELRCDLATYALGTTQMNLAACNKSPGGIQNLQMVGEFKELKVLDLGENGFTTLPHIESASLRTLLLGYNPLGELQNSFSALPQLAFLGLRSCSLTHVDAAIFPRSLVSLVLTDNLLTIITNLDHLPALRKVMLSHNDLSALPPLPRSLELLRIAANPKLNAKGLNTVLTLPRLKWIGCGATPIARQTVNKEVIDVLPKGDVSISGKTLGSGASGQVSLGTYQGSPVAVKVYKKKSSDGYSTSEVAVLRTLRHDDLITSVGVLEDPSRLVMQYLQDASPLGRPPNMSTSVRDVKSPNVHYTKHLIVEVALAVARAMTYLHSMGVAHGDLYAHNILFVAIEGKYTVKLSDFGASWFTKGESEDGENIAGLMEAVELRAYGVLIDDLRGWCSACDGEIGRHLEQLVEKCIFGGFTSFEEVVHYNKAIA